MVARFIDDRRRELLFARPPARVVSLVPSDTETLFALGAGDRVVGRTRYCVEPAGAVDAVPVCGGSKDVDVDAVLALAPELVLCNQEENARPQLEAMARLGLPVFVAFPRRVADGIGHTARLARLLGIDAGPPLCVFAPIWRDPWMTMAADTYGSDVLACAGAINAFADRARRYPLAADLGIAPALPADQVGDRDTRYPRITLAEVVERAPEVVLLPDEPYRFGRADAEVMAALAIPAAARGAIHLCDGKDLFWYGARSAAAVQRVRKLLYSG
jgi:ABC-type hemin transport system substrate-binding protein